MQYALYKIRTIRFIRFPHLPGLLESYDLSGKTIVPFCTSGSSGIGSSATNLHSLASNAAWLDGQRFSGGASSSAVETWVNGLGLTLTPGA